MSQRLVLFWVCVLGVAVCATVGCGSAGDGGREICVGGKESCYASGGGVRLPAKEVTGGRGYYRTPTLVNVWATAPFLHNNSVGMYNGDPSVAGRLEAYESGIELMLWPERRLGRKSIRRTSERSRFSFEDGSSVCVARDTPIDLITNVRVTPRQPSGRNKLLDRVLCGVTGSGAVNPLLLLMDNAPDFVQDRGHTYGAGLADADKRALIEYMKRF